MSGTIECPTSSSHSLINQSIIPWTKSTTTPIVILYSPLNSSKIPCAICLTASQAFGKSPWNRATIAFIMPDMISTTPLIVWTNPSIKPASAEKAPAITPVTTLKITPPIVSKILPIPFSKSVLSNHSLIELAMSLIPCQMSLSNCFKPSGIRLDRASPIFLKESFIFSSLGAIF